MHYYQFHIGDYATHTRHLTPIEDIAYRRLLDLYYLHERPFNDCSTTVARLINMRGNEDIVEAILNEFFDLIEGKGWVNTRADKEIIEFHKKAHNASMAGKASAKKRASTTVERPLNDRSTNHKPLTINHIGGDLKKNDDVEVPVSKKPAKPKIEKKGTRLSKDWKPSAELLEACRKKRPDLNIESTAEVFRDYWASVPGAKGLKLDWDATFRVWVSKQHAAKGTIGGSVVSKPSSTRYDWLKTTARAIDRITGDVYYLKGESANWQYDPKGYYGAPGLIALDGSPPVAASALIG